MARRRPIRRRTPRLGLIAAQVVVLVMLLIGLLAFRDRIGAGAEVFFDAVSAPDVQVAQPAPAPPAPTPESHAPDDVRVPGGAPER